LRYYLISKLQLRADCEDFLEITGRIPRK